MDGNGDVDEVNSSRVKTRADDMVADETTEQKTPESLSRAPAPPK
jgi:hypothetical protein